MYNTTDDYKEKVYKNGVRHELNIYFIKDGEKIPVDDNAIMGCTYNSKLFDDVVELGSTPKKTVEISLYKDAYDYSYSELYIESGIRDGEIVPIGTFIITEVKEENEFLISITAKDYMEKFEFNFDGSKYTPPYTLKSLLGYICGEAGVTLASTSFLNDSTIINVYDSTVTARTYIGYIAEQAGGFAVIGRDDKLYIKDFNICNNLYRVNDIYSEDDGISIDVNGWITVDYTNNENVEKTIRLINNANQNIRSNTTYYALIEIDSADETGGTLQLMNSAYQLEDANMMQSGSDVTDKFTFEDGELYKEEGDKDTTLDYDTGNIRDDNFFNQEVSALTGTYNPTLYASNEYGDSDTIFQHIITVQPNSTVKFKYRVSIYTSETTTYESMPRIDINLFSEYTFGSEDFKCSRLVFEDGTRTYQYGTEEGNTIYIDQDNMFIVDDGDNTCTQLQNVFDKVKGLKLNSFTGTSIVDIALDIGDIVEIGGRYVIFQGSIEYLGFNKGSIDSEIQVKEQEEISNVVKNSGNSTKIRRLQSTINQQEGYIQTLASEVTDISDKQSTITQKVDDISIKVEDVENLTYETYNKVGSSVQRVTDSEKDALAGEIVKLSVTSINVKTLEAQFDENGAFVNPNAYLQIYGKQFYPEINNTLEVGLIDSSGNPVDGKSYIRSKDFFPLNSNVASIQTWIDTGKDYNLGVRFLYCYDSNKKFLGSSSFEWKMLSDSIYRGFKILENTKYIKYVIYEYVYDSSTGYLYWQVDGSESAYDIQLSYLDGLNLKYRFFENVNLKITTPLRWCKDSDNNYYYDEYVYDYLAKTEDGELKSYVIRRVGVDDDGNKYPLAVETKEAIDVDYLELLDGQNWFYFVDYDSTISDYRVIYCDLTYVIKNKFTSTFATNYSILAEISVAIEDGRGVISLTGDDVVITSENFKVTGEGKVTAKSGEIAGLSMTRDEGTSISYLNKSYTKNDISYISGFLIPDTVSSDMDFLYAGAETDGTTDSAGFRLTHYGNVYMNGEDKKIRIVYDNGRTAMSLDMNGMRYYRNNDANEYIGCMLNWDDRLLASLYQMGGFRVYDELNSEVLIDAKRKTSSSASEIFFYGNCYIDRTRSGTGYRITTTEDTSDKNLKHDIKECETKALDKINQLKFKQFTWNDDTPTPNVHIDIGLIAQEVEEVDTNYIGTTTRVKNGVEEEIYRLNSFNLLTSALKAIQELSQKNDQLEDRVSKLEEEIIELKNLIKKEE